jgi:drug/metabolite transporter (DMT)-like permease
MKAADIVDLLLLAALWGGSFLFMRVAVPAFGPVALVELRVLVAAVLLLAIVAWRGELTALRANLGRASLLGVVNSALPFFLYTYATLTITAGFAAILNATVPMWTAAIGVLWLHERIRASQWLGLALGALGVVVLVWGKVDLRPGSTQWTATLAVGAALLATLAYGVAVHLARRLQAGVAPLVTACGSQIGAAALMAAPAVWLWPAQMPGASLWLAVLALGIGCTGVAYVLYFRLIARTGALRAASVTFLMGRAVPRRIDQRADDRRRRNHPGRNDAGAGIPARKRCRRRSRRRGVARERGRTRLRVATPDPLAVPIAGHVANDASGRLDSRCNHRHCIRRPAGPSAKPDYGWFLRCCQSTSVPPAARFSTRASTNSRSLSRFTYWRGASFSFSSPPRATIDRSARRHTARHTCAAAAGREPPGSMNSASRGRLAL